jgi:hypothetical protein
MYKIDIFIKTYEKDFKWLQFCLESINKFVYNINNIIIAIPQYDYDKFNEILNIKHLHNISNNIKYIVTNDYGDTYLYQQYIKMTSYQYSDADLIMFVDSDVIFKEETNIYDLFIENKPIIYYTPYQHVGIAICWKQPTSQFIGEEQHYEFMRRNCLIYFRDTISTIHIQYPNLEEIIMGSGSSIGFSEFNAIGAWAFKNEKDRYHFINSREVPPKPQTYIQFWSQTNINDQDLKEINRILYDNN